MFISGFSCPVIYFFGKKKLLGFIFTSLHCSSQILIENFKGI